MFKTTNLHRLSNICDICKISAKLQHPQGITFIGNKYEVDDKNTCVVFINGSKNKWMVYGSEDAEFDVTFYNTFYEAIQEIIGLHVGMQYDYVTFFNSKAMREHIEEIAEKFVQQGKHFETIEQAIIAIEKEIDEKYS